MKEIIDFFSGLPGIPIEHLIGMIALAVIGLSGFALYVVHSALKK